MSKKYLPISISSNKILKILLNPSANDSTIEFDNLFSKIKSDEEKSAISLLTIGLGNFYYSGKATTYIMEKFNINSFQLKLIPENEIQNFWRYLPSFVNCNKTLSQLFHFFLPFVPKYYDNQILTALMNIKYDNQILLTTYVESIDDLFNNFQDFLKIFFVTNFPTPMQIQSVISILAKRDKTFPELLKLFENCKDKTQRFGLEYSLIFYLSSFHESIGMLNSISNLMMLFLNGTVDFKSQLFESLCFFINRSIVSIDSPKTNEEYEDYPFYVLRKMKEANVASHKLIVKQATQKINTLIPISIYYLFAIHNEKLYKQLAIQLTQIKDPLLIIERCYKKGTSINDEKMLYIIYHVICALFVRTPLDSPSFKQTAELAKKLPKICFPIQFLSKIADMICEPDCRDLAFELLKIDDQTRQDIYLKLNDIVEADYPTNQIDKDFINNMITNPSLTIHVFISLCSSIIYTSTRARKNRLISVVKRTMLTYFAENNVFFDDIVSSVPGLDECASSFQELFEHLKKNCGKESDFHDITDETFDQSI